MNFVALDFETANRLRSSICQIGLAVFKNGELYETKSLLVKPKPFRFEPINMSIHGIFPEDVISKPRFDEYWSELKVYFEGQEMLAHNAAFDFSVLRATLNLYKINFPDLNYYCSLLISRKMLPGEYSYSLPHICNKFGISFRHHDAVADAEAAGKLAVSIMRKYGFSSLRQMSETMGFNIGRFRNNSYVPFSTKNSKNIDTLNI
jgi:DNA polymerase-3 subunit epsilon